MDETKDIKQETEVKEEKVSKTEESASASSSEDNITVTELQKILDEMEKEVLEKKESGEREEVEEGEELEGEEEVAEDEDEEEKSIDVEEVYVEADEIFKSLVEEIEDKQQDLVKRLDSIKKSLERREKIDKMLAETLTNLGKVLESINTQKTNEVAKKSVSETETKKVNPEEIKNKIMELAIKGEITPKEVMAYEIAGIIPDKLKI